MKRRFIFPVFLLFLLFSSGLHAGDDFSFYATPPTPGCCGTCDYGPELVTNGDFSAPCNTGYGSDLNYRDCTNPGYLGCGGYSETTDASIWNTGWVGMDHTGNGSRALLVDGPCNNGAYQRVWFQNVNVTQGQTYCFTAWVKNVKNSGSNEPDLDLRVGGLSGQVLASVTDLKFVDGWVQLCGNFVGPVTGPIELDVVARKHNGSSENDFMVDDISFRKVNNCEDCCENIHVEWNPPYNPNPFSNSCQGSFTVWYDDMAGCNFDTIIGYGPITTSIHDTSTDEYYFNYQLPYYSAAIMRFDFLDIDGNVICSFDTLINCDHPPIRETGCCGECVYGPELVVNGDFSAVCNSAYNSDMNYTNCNTVGPLGSSGYTETADASLWNPGWVGMDHTGNGSRAMLVDGPRNPAGNQRVWFQTVQVEAQETYCFSAWVKNVLNNTSNEPDLDLRVGGLGGQIVGSVTNLAFNNGWTQICGTFVAPANMPIEIDVVAGSHSSGFANDFMVDDISFRKVSDCINNPYKSAEAKSLKADALHMDLSPNPAHRAVQVSVRLLNATPYSVEIMNLQGQVLARRAAQADGLQATLPLNIADYSPGMYFVRLRQGDQVINKPLLIQR